MNQKDNSMIFLRDNVDDCYYLKCKRCDGLIKISAYRIGFFLCGHCYCKYPIIINIDQETKKITIEV
jgi:hypothetical protein